MDVIPGGKRRGDRVLDAAFLEDLTKLSTAAVRERRSEAEQEETDVSYLRRLLHGRIDILRDELRRRTDGGDTSVSSLVERLPAILSDPSPGTFGAVSRLLLPSSADKQRRRVERLVSDETMARLPDLDTGQIERVVSSLAVEEAKVSEHRRRLLAVLDTLRGELARRYREGSVDVSELLEE